ncbi:hypothetical protein [Pelosinus propionicus]|uniref:Uncharacterized protein n=1 Tax=Pelosinus propionicus DSM 13327 TaxID=1123291 RepID=A0A1I4PU48_9FIRM|nr:hypothetical protein [Pelosinus propionicus]SFM31076.1 hypothetical protein SAMN04490355_107225 [Pelosinus propionicus DSM 13327]
MKKGYKVFIGVSVLHICLVEIASVKIPSTIENAMGYTLLIALLYAWFIEKSPIKPYTSTEVRECRRCGEKVYGTGIYCRECSFKEKQYRYHYHEKV